MTDLELKKFKDDLWQRLDDKKDSRISMGLKGLDFVND